MIIGQSTTLTFHFAPLNKDVSIKMTIHLESPGEAGVDVAIDYLFARFLVEELQDSFGQFLSNAIHGGIAAENKPLPVGGLKISVHELSITPETILVRDGKLVDEIMRIIENTTSAIVANLCYASDNTIASSRSTKRKRVPKDKLLG